MFEWNEILKAAGGEPCIAESGPTKGVPTLNCIPAVFISLINTALLFAGIVAVVMIILGGIKFITSGGDPKQVEGARNTLTWAIVGLIVILLSFAILNFIGVITGASNIITQFGFPTP